MVKKFLEKTKIVEYIHTLFMLLALFLVGMIFFRAQSQWLLIKEQRYSEIESFSQKLDFALKEKVDAICYLNRTATFLLESSPKNCSVLVDMVKEREHGAYYSIDDDYIEELPISNRTNLTGYGLLEHDKLDQELCMALSLSPFFKTMSKRLKESTWFYYTSKKGFINLYPYVHSYFFRLKEDDMNKACYLYATPKLNPQKKIFWSPLYVDAGGLGLMTTVGKPVYHDGQFKGVVALDMTLEHLHALLDDESKFVEKKLLVNKEGEVLAAHGIEGFLSEKVTQAKRLLPKDIVDATISSGAFIDVENFYLYKKKLHNAPWDLIVYIPKIEIYKVVFIAILPALLLFIFMLVGKFLIDKILVAQKELEHLNSHLEEKVKEKIQELEIQRSTYETLFERAGSGICILDKAKIIACNDAFMKMLGYDEKEALIGHYILEFSPKNQEDGTRSLKSARSLQRKLIKEGEHTWQWQAQRRDDKQIWMEIVSKVIMIDGKKVVQLIIQDITKRKMLEKRNKEQMNQLLQQSRLAQMGEMLSMISHQWRQPLSSISMVAMNLEVKIKSGKLRQDSVEEGDKFLLSKLGQIEKYIQYLATTIDDFRDFFKPQKEKKRFDINLLIDETIELIAPTLENKGIEIVKSYQAKEMIFSYENEIKQVILNILNNAKDVLLETNTIKPSIMISTYCEHEECFVEIEDNGGGIAKEHVAYVFDPYFSTKSKNGTGLGLYMSKTIIQEHCKGELSVENSRLGAKFTIVLPLS